MQPDRTAPLDELRRRQPRYTGLEAGHRACQGCGEALAARVVREVGDLLRRARAAGKRLATLSVDTEIRFRSAADRAAFSREMTESIGRLVARYHDESAPGGRRHRLVVMAHPLPQEAASEES